jgi:hypothetical protein
MRAHACSGYLGEGGAMVLLRADSGSPGGIVNEAAQLTDENVEHWPSFSTQLTGSLAHAPVKHARVRFHRYKASSGAILLHRPAH